MPNNFSEISLPFYADVPENVQQFVAEQIIPQYAHFDAAHRCDHALSVIQESMALSKYYPVKPTMVYMIAACHDLGLCEGRATHHIVSARIIQNMKTLRQWFTEEEIEIMAEAAEDHRASAKHVPRTIYGKIVAEADRLIDTDTVLRRTVQYGLAHYPQLSKEEHFKRMVEHLNEKYAEGGYLQLWIPESSNARRLENLRKVIAQPQRLQDLFNLIYQQEK